MGDRSSARKVRGRGPAGHVLPARWAALPRLEALDDRAVPAVVTWQGPPTAGGGTFNWSDPQNWAGGVAPKAGDDLVFPGTVGAGFTAGGTVVNDYPVNTPFSSISIGTPGSAAPANAVVYTFTGNGVVLNGGGASRGILDNLANPAANTSPQVFAIPVTFTTTAQQVSTTQAGAFVVFTQTAPLSLTGVDLTFSSQSGAATSITVNGRIGGSGNVVVGVDEAGGAQATGTVQFSANGGNNYTGTTTVKNGNLILAPVTVNAALVPGGLTIGDDNNLLGNATVTLQGATAQGPNAIADTATVTVLSDGVLAMNGSSDIIQDLALGSAVGGGQVTATGGGTLGLNGNLTAVAGSTRSQVDATVDLSSFAGGHTFTVSRGTNPTQPDLLFTGTIQGLTSNTLTFTGSGKTELRGAANGVAFTTVVAGGEVDLNNLFAFANGVLPGDVVIGSGGTPAIVKELAGNGVADTAVVTIGAGSTFDLSGIGAFGETILALSGTDSSAKVDFGTGEGQLILQPSRNYRYAGTVTGRGQIRVSSNGSGGLNGGGSQEFSGAITTTSNTYASALQATGTGVLVVDSNVSGQVDSGILLNGTIAGTGSVVNLNTNFTGTIMPGTYPASAVGQQASQSNFVPGTLTTQNLDLEDGTLAVQINDASTFGQIAVTQSISNNFFFPTLRVTLPTGFVPSGGAAFEILDIRPTGITLFNQQNQNFLGFTDANTGQLLTEGSTFSIPNSTARFTISYRGGDGNDVVIYNTQAASSTVSQGTVTGNTATFVATFGGPVGPISPSGIQVATTGTVGYSFVSTTRLSDTQYLISVNGLTGTGNVTVTLAQGAAVGGSGTPAQGSLTTDGSNTVAVTAGGGGTGGGGTGGGGGTTSPPPPALSNNPGGRFLVGTGAGGTAANVYQGQTTASQALSLPVPQFIGGVRVATGDFNRDGVRDYVFATGPGQSSFFEVMDGQTGALLFSAAPFEASFTGGLNVATGDLNGDGVPELVVTPDQGGGPRVLVFNGVGFGVLADFIGIADPNFRGGARAAIGDLNGDGIGDLAVAAGYGGGPRVAVYDGKTVPGGFPTKLLNDFFVFEPSLRNGAYLTIADVNGDGKGDLIAGGGPGGAPRVTVFDGLSLTAGAVNPVSSFYAGDPNGRGGIRLATVDYDGNGTLAVATGAGEGDGSEVRVYAPANLVAANPIPEASFEAFPGFTGGVFVG